ncbi:MAG: ATP-binding protein [Limnohabitans sp.]|nr:ATP-binding protein [Limnohabitans sp.]
MKDRVKLTDAGSYYLNNVKRNLKMSGQDNYIPMRIAFARSLQINKDPFFEDKNEDALEKIQNTKAKEQPPLTTIEQGDGLVFRALLSQRYKRKIDGDEYVDLLSKHIEHGLYIINYDTEKLRGYDYLVAISSTQNNNANNQEATEYEHKQDLSILSVKVGINKANKEPIIFNINIANNPHFAIMGGSGSGKTYFLKHLLTEIRKNSHEETNFIIFDYKDGDIAQDKEFLQNANAELIDVKNNPLPLNIFAGATTDKEQKERAERIVEIVKNVEANIGKVQENNLYNAILNAYKNCSPYPDFDAIKAELEQINPKPDSLTSVLRPLIDLNYFAAYDEKIYGSWTNKTLVIDIHEIERKELLCFLVLNQVHKELKKLGVSPQDPKTKARKIRTFIVIDEAHYFLSNPKRAKILENMIRDVRSTGGAIILASQSPDDYDKGYFNFLELIEFPIILKSTPSSYKFIEQKFSMSAQKSKELLREIGTIERGEAYISKNILVELCK